MLSLSRRLSGSVAAVALLVMSAGQAIGQPPGWQAVDNSTKLTKVDPRGFNIWSVGAKGKVNNVPPNSIVYIDITVYKLANGVGVV